MAVFGECSFNWQIENMEGDKAWVVARPSRVSLDAALEDICERGRIPFVPPQEVYEFPWNADETVHYVLIAFTDPEFAP